MTSEDKAAMVKAMSGETQDGIVSAYLFLAGQKIIKLACPKGATEVPEEWDALHIEATVYMLNKRGAEGQSSHGENGVSRTYENADLPDSLLRSYGLVGRCEVVT